MGSQVDERSKVLTEEDLNLEALINYGLKLADIGEGFRNPASVPETLEKDSDAIHVL